MRPNTGRGIVLRTLRRLALALAACLAFAVVAPMYFADRRVDDSFAISTVSAAPRALHVLTVPVRLSTAPDLTLVRAVISDYGPAAGRTTSQVQLDGPVFALNASGRPAAATRDTAEGSDVDPTHDDTSLPMAPVLQQIAALGFDLLAIRRGALHITMADGSVETINDIQAELKKTSKGQIASLGSFTVRGQHVAFEATLSPPADKTQPLRLPLQLAIKSGIVQGSLDGHVDLGNDLQIAGDTDLSISSLRALGRWFGLPLYLTDGFNTTSIKGDLTWAHRSLGFEKAHISVDGNEGNGSVMLNLGADRPMIEATLDFASLNLTPYVEAARIQFFGFELPGTWWSSFDISLPMIRYLDADLRISAQRVTLKDQALGQGAATISSQAGKLHADITELDLPAGTLSAQVTAIMSEAAPHYALRAKIDKLDAAAASALLLRAPALSGSGTLSFDVTSTGYSLAEVTRRLSGKAELTLPEGGRLGLDLKAVRASAREGTRGWAGLAKTPTSLDKLEARALIIDGVAFAEGVQARAGDIALALTGRLGLVDGNVDARLMWKSGVPPNEPLKLSDSAAEAVNLRGPWSKPDVRGDDADTGVLRSP
jgi:AsmA protein